MGRIYIKHISEAVLRAYKCRQCGTELTLERDFIYKDNLGIKRGEALMFKSVENVFFGSQQDKLTN